MMQRVMLNKIFTIHFKLNWRRLRIRIEYTNKNKEVKKATKKDSQTFVEGMAEEAERAAAEQRMGDFYQIARKLCGKRRNTNMSVRDKHGKLIRSEQQLQKRWNEHFEEVLNRPEPNRDC